MPQQWRQSRALAFGNGQTEDHDGRGHHEKDEAIHREQMRDTTLRILELARGQDLVRHRAQGDAELFPAGDFTLGDLLQRPTPLEKKLGTLLMYDVQQCAADDQKDHQNDVRLHDTRIERKALGQNRERVTCDHWMMTPN